MKRRQLLRVFVAILISVLMQVIMFLVYRYLEHNFAHYLTVAIGLAVLEGSIIVTEALPEQKYGDLPYDT